MNIVRRLTMAAATASIALGGICGVTQPVRAQSPSWLSSSVIYCVNPEIFSSNGLAGVTSQLTRIHNLGCNVLWIMPIYPRGVATTVNGVSHPSFNSPYCIHDMQAVDGFVGTSASLTTLVSTAHGLGMKVILDMAINATSWDNPLVTSHPQYYLHSDGNVNNVGSIENGWGVDTDIAQFNLTTDTYGAQTYVTNVCKYWLQTYNLDGFRFDSADNPSGTGRSLPQSLMNNIATALRAINPNLMLIGEDENVGLALSPYNVDYGWNMYYYGIGYAFTQANYESTLQYQWQYPYTINNTSPATMLHMNIQDDWDVTNRDNVVLGGYAQAMAAAVWDFTVSGVPLMYNGMEVANTNGGSNSHTVINWTGTNSAAFTTFYTQLLALRNGSGGALQQGTTSFITNSSPAVISYLRTGGGNSYVVEINTNGGAASGTITSQAGTWTDVTPAGAPGGKNHSLPSTGTFSLQGYDFAIFKLGTASVPPAPTGLIATAGNAQASLTWTASSGASTYNLFRSTTAGGEGTSPIVTGIAGTTYNNTGLTNGTTYYFKVSAVNSVGTSSQSNEASATPAATTSGSLTGTVTSVTAAQAFNLTTQGTTDWAAFGYNNTFNHSSAGGSKISNCAVAGGGSMNTFTSSFLGSTWTNGTPTASVTNETAGYYNNGGVGDGFSFTVPAGTAVQHLTVYVGGWSSGGTLTATLSDGSAATYTNSALSNSSNSYYAHYDLTFNAASAGKTLTVTWKEASGTGNVTLYAATLH